jgi:hypothetical protein
MFIIKGINYLLGNNAGKDYFIKVDSPTSHTTLPDISESITRFDTIEEAESVAKSLVIGAFKNYEILEEGK